MDRLNKERRSWNMGRIPSRNSVPEITVRSALHRLGFRFRLHGKALPGKPDIVLPKWNHVVFVHGCFWHRHPGCKMAYTPKSRTEFWAEKFNRNVARDEAARRALTTLGWSVSTIWECETGNPQNLAENIKALAARIRSTQRIQREFVDEIYRPEWTMDPTREQTGSRHHESDGR